MLTALIIATTATVLILAALAFVVLTGWSEAPSGRDAMTERGRPSRLNPRDWAEVVARLWVL